MLVTTVYNNRFVRENTVSRNPNINLLAYIWPIWRGISVSTVVEFFLNPHQVKDLCRI